MSQSGTYQALNRLLTILYRSLPVYLTYASPWTTREDAKAVETLRHIVDDQQQMSNRLAQHITEHYGPVEMGEYPLDFPDTHDLAFDFLIGKLLAGQQASVVGIERCVAEITDDREALALAEEALGSARGHLETLEELAAATAKEGTTWAKQ